MWVCRYDEIRIVQVNHLVSVWLSGNEEKSQALHKKLDEKIEKYAAGELEHAAEAIFSIWDSAHKNEAPPSVKDPAHKNEAPPSIRDSARKNKVLPSWGSVPKNEALPPHGAHLSYPHGAHLPRMKLFPPFPQVPGTPTGLLGQGKGVCECR